MNKDKLKNIAYWVTTAMVFLLFAGGGVFDMLQPPEALQMIAALGYPDYFTFWIGVAKVLGALAFIQPKFPKLKEWAYAGFIFDLVGALVSHIESGDELKNFAPIPIFILIVGFNYWLNSERNSRKAVKR